MSHLTVALVAFAVTASSAPIVRTLAIRYSLLDVPNHRSSHLVPIPRAGGIACVLGLVVGLAVAEWLGLVVSWRAFVCVIVLASVGFIDDWRSLPAMPRLGLQALTGIACGWAIDGPTMALMGLLLFPAVVNVVNFMDGINGISGVTLGVWGLAAAFASGPGGALGLATLGLVAVGISGGFLPWNLPRAQLFLGDSGSYMIGTVMASGVLLGLSSEISVGLLLAPLLIYFTDVAFTLWRRARRGVRLTDAHREHIYQQLAVARSLSHAKVSGIVAALSALTVGSWVVLDWRMSLIVSGMVAIGYLFLPRRIATMPEGSRHGSA